MIESRRSFLTGLAGTIIAAPAIVRASSLMKVRSIAAGPSYAGVDYVLSRPFAQGQIRDILMPGIRKIAARYEGIPLQWEELFRQCQN